MTRSTTPENIGLHHDMDEQHLKIMLDYVYNTNYETYIKCLDHVHSYMQFMEREKAKWFAINRPNASIPSSIASKSRMSTGGSDYSDSMFDSPGLMERIEDELLEYESTPTRVNGSTTTLTHQMKRSKMFQ